MVEPSMSSLRCHPAYRDFCAELEQIERHKWLASEVAGRDVGFEQALLEWVGGHRDAWRRGVQVARGEDRS
jgi:hypothetical protein